MTTITIQIPDDKAKALVQAAERSGNSLEEYATTQLIGIADAATIDPKDAEAFRLIHEIVEEHKELYKRLA